ncbi:hypothetical protein BC827DRAFT_200269 [Russula dissimulans]|nr:hypothetical protein BC827DRAFT_200269 [Russula dissimulans]
MAKPRFLFSTSRPITQPYRDDDSLKTPYFVAVAPTNADYLPPSDTLAPTAVMTHHTIDAPSKEVYTQLDTESTQISGYTLQEEFVLPGPPTRQSHRRFWMVLSLAIGVLLILAIGVGVGIPSSLHDLANIKSNSGSGVDIGSGIHIRIGRDTGNSSDNGNSTTGTSFCITDTCPGSSDSNSGSGSGNSSGNSGSSSGNSGNSSSGNSGNSSSGGGGNSSSSGGGGGGKPGSGNRATGSLIVTLAMAVTAAAFLSVW